MRQNMDVQKLRQVIASYSSELREAGVSAIDVQDAPPYMLLNHCAWMLETMTKMLTPPYPPPASTSAPADVLIVWGLDQMTIEKCMRWLGFVQGVFATLGVYNVTEMREHSRSGKVGPSRTLAKKQESKPCPDTSPT